MAPATNTSRDARAAALIVTAAACLVALGVALALTRTEPPASTTGMPAFAGTVTVDPHLPDASPITSDVWASVRPGWALISYREAWNNTGGDERPTLLVTTVDIAEGQAARIEVRLGDDPIDVARTFCVRHGLPETIVLPLAQHLEGVEAPHVAPGATHVWHQYTIRVPQDRDGFAKALADEYGVGSGVYYPIPNHQLPSFGLTYDLPNTAAACAQVLSLPVHPALSQADLEQIVAGVNAVAKAGA